MKDFFNGDLKEALINYLNQQTATNHIGIILGCILFAIVIICLI